jgi:hypothetical protein
MSTHSSPNEKLLKRRPRASSLRRIEYLSFKYFKHYHSHIYLAGLIKAII